MFLLCCTSNSSTNLHIFFGGIEFKSPSGNIIYLIPDYLYEIVTIEDFLVLFSIFKNFLVREIPKRLIIKIQSWYRSS